MCIVLYTNIYSSPLSGQNHVLKVSFYVCASTVDSKMLQVWGVLQKFCMRFCYNVSAFTIADFCFCEERKMQEICKMKALWNLRNLYSIIDIQIHAVFNHVRMQWSYHVLTIVCFINELCSVYVFSCCIIMWLVFQAFTQICKYSEFLANVLRAECIMFWWTYTLRTLYTVNQQILACYYIWRIAYFR